MSMLNIVHVYEKKRSEFGRQTKHFTDSDVHVLCDIHQDPIIKQKYIIQNPRDIATQCISEKTEHATNTPTVDTSDHGMRHTEGGWPKDVDVTQAESKHRAVLKETKKPGYKPAVLSLAEPMEHFLKQNSALDIFNMYFEEEEKIEEPEKTPTHGSTQKQEKTPNKVSFAQTYLTDPPRANMVSVLKDPSDTPRTASHISWLPGDGSKIAVSFAQVNFDMTTSLSNSINPDFSSYIWDLNNPNEPDCAIQPHSPLYCLEFNPKDSNLLVGGCYNGVVALFDTRNDSDHGPILESDIKLSHREPIYDVRWIQSKNSTLFLSVSTDGLVNLWDTRNMSAPTETLELLLKDDKNGNPPKFKGLLGSMSLHYNATHSAAKFMVGTEQGAVVACTRRKNKPTLIDRSYFGHHGPIYSVMRNPFIPKYFLTIGDWTAKIWEEEIEDPIISTRFHDCYLTSGCWSNSRPGVFFVTKSTGDLDIYDFYHNQNKPIVSLNVSDAPLHSIRVFNGERLAVGGCDGSVTIVELSNYLSGFRNGEKSIDHTEMEFIKAMFDREASREKNLIGKRKEREALMKDSKPKTHDHPSRIVLEDFPADFEDSHVPKDSASEPASEEPAAAEAEEPAAAEEDAASEHEEDDETRDNNADGGETIMGRVGNDDNPDAKAEADKAHAEPEPQAEEEEPQELPTPVASTEDPAPVEEANKEEAPATKEEVPAASDKKEEEPAKKEEVQEEPAKEASPVKEEPVKEEPVQAEEEPAKKEEEPVKEEAKVEEPVKEEPVKEEPPKPVEKQVVPGGKCSITIVSVANCGGADLFSKPDPYVKWSFDKKSGKTKTKKSTKDPTFNETFSLDVSAFASAPPITFTLMEDDFLKDDTLGSVSYSFPSDLVKDKDHSVVLTFETKKKQKQPTTLTITVTPSFGVVE